MISIRMFDSRPAKFRLPKVGLGLLLSFGLLSNAPVVADEEWCDLGFDLAGTHGSPVLEGDGHMCAGSRATVTLSNVKAKTTAFIVVGLSASYLPFKGGTWVPDPFMILGIPTKGTDGVPSTVVLDDHLPGNLPVGTEIYIQYWIIDDAGPEGFAASNALKATTREFYEVVSDDFDDKLEAADPPATSMPIYTQQDFSNQDYIRNLDCWAASVDLTGLSPWNQTGGPTRAGTLISPRHIAFAQHYSLSTTPGNNELVFVTEDNQTITRKLEAVAFPGGDIGIGVLDEDVPPEIAFYPVLPRNWADDLPDVAALPMLHLDQEEKAIVRNMRYLSTNCGHATPPDDLRKQFSETLIGGDSGNPAFLLFGDQAVFILTHYTSVHGPFYTGWFDEVNNAMSSLGGGYQLTEFSIRDFIRQ